MQPSRRNSRSVRSTKLTAQNLDRRVVGHVLALVAAADPKWFAKLASQLVAKHL